MVLRPLIDSATVEAYGQVLGLFYNIPLRIATNEVKAALSQSEMIVRVATALECLPLVRPHVSNAIADYRQQLYRAIKADPVRWTLLAQSLQNEPLFTECFVHLVGAYPLSPWPTKRNALTNELRQRITTRSKALDQICLVVDRELLMLTIEVGDSPVAPNDSQNKETWLLVQLFRDAISRQLHTLDDKRRALSCGTFYRKLARGGSNYMDYEEISKLCASLMNSDWRDLGEELKLLKQYASRAVQVLASNELMLDPDANDVGYLTCVKVGKQDFPW
ncbi:hypothetical protein EJ04DRAFT_428779 [Polyplosphaeria fusca]|uniref:Uncharacterized protein n=1 Tax=Polyplosphaeria fusca TaxID=682080 RepID=A0A9P4R3B1_9PLEO|nr:hypothetical protein EJ04DRAFT_428779 [Polyplosphaeria fusca]